ncbi:MAG TPA: phosphoglycerate kinase [Gemmatimonadota bacterium]|nr:phosphoglycerate kinase [Gemmatimonadota bacterium]
MSPGGASSALERLSLDDLDPAELSGRRVLVRVDFNVPLEGSGAERRVSSDVRIRAALPTIEALLEHASTVVLASHLGRPKGPDPELTMEPVAGRLEELLGRPVAYSPDSLRGVPVPGRDDGGVVLLENLRFDPGEKANDPAFAERLASLADLFVQDAFGTCHRAHASTVGVTEHLDPCVAGKLVQRELAAFRRLLASPRPPFVSILGGAKVAGKLETLRGLLGRCDRVCLGGGMANTFLLARGLEVGDSLVEPDLLGEARALLERHGDALELPVDVVVARELAPGADARTVGVTEVEPGWKIFDAGPVTVEAFGDRIRSAGTVFWNGPLGVFETPPFDAGTRAFAELMASATDGGAYTVVGGGDSIAAIEEAGRLADLSHASTGGGAALELVSGVTLPGIAALDPPRGGRGRGEKF